MQKLTPMFEQYLRIKEENPDALLFFRMGDFYELFFEDAERAARELQIALTSRDPDSKIPMCGVPHHAVDGYLSQLLDKGYTVALCDQIEDPKQAKGLVKRAVTRVYTPGTVVEDANLTAKDPNHLAALWWTDASDAGGGLAWVDFSTGQWTGLQTARQAELWQWVQKVAPRELILADEMKVPTSIQDGRIHLVRVPAAAYFDYQAAKARLLKVQPAASLSVFDLEDKRQLTCACGALLAYLAQTQKQDHLTHLGLFKPLNLSRHLLLDELTERNLELFLTLDGKTGKGTLRQVIDRTLTPMGGRLLAHRLRYPWREVRPIGETLDAVAHFYHADADRERLRSSLNRVYDLERLSTRIFLGRAMPKDFVALRQSLTALPEIRSTLNAMEQEPPKALAAVLAKWDDLADQHDLLTRALRDDPPPLVTDGGLFRPGYHAELDKLMDLTEHGEAKLQELLAEEQAGTGLSKLKMGYNKVFGYFFEVPRSQTDKAPEHFIRRQTLANCERYATPKLKELEDRLLAASDQQKQLEYALFQELRQIVADARSRFLFMADALAALDYWQGLAEAARRWNWSRPVLHDGVELDIVAGRHPVVEAVQGPGNFIPNDMRLDGQRNLCLITGPNMAGKSTVLRQTALICLMAQAGSFVPAQEARLGLVDRIFSRVGASDNLAQGQSTFMVEMTETARILRHAGKRSLIILDEIGRGTSTFDGLALAWAVVEDLANRNSGVIRTLFATHYHELTALETQIPTIKNMNIAVKEWAGDIVFLRRLVPGPADRSYGIEVAKLAGVPQAVVQRAREILASLEQSRAARESPRPSPATQALLPGLDPQAASLQTEQELTILNALKALNVDQLTPMEALGLLHRWRTQLTED